MDFREATDRLTSCVTLGDLARASGVSDASVRRARLDPTSSAYRSPPPNWREAVVKLARERADRLARLASEVEADRLLEKLERDG